MTTKMKSGSTQRFVGDAAHVVADNAKKAAVATRAGATKAVAATRDGAKIALDATGKFAQSAAKFVDDKTREALAREFEKARPAAVSTLAQRRKENPASKPVEIISQLNAEFSNVEKNASATSTAFTAAAANYVLTLNEIYGNDVRDTDRRIALINIVLAANSGVAKAVVQVGAGILTFVSKRFLAVAVVAGVVNFLNKHASKVTWLGVVAKLAGIKNPAHKGAAWIVITASRRVFGEPPTTWPAATKATAAKKTVATKPAGKKPAAKPATRKPTTAKKPTS